MFRSPVIPISTSKSTANILRVLASLLIIFDPALAIRQSFLLDTSLSISFIFFGVGKTILSINEIVSTKVSLITSSKSSFSFFNKIII